MRSKINKLAVCLIMVFALASAFSLNVKADADGDIYTEDDMRRSGNLNADSYRFIANQSVKSGEPEFDIAIAIDTNTEEPLLSLFLTGEDIKKIAELEASYSSKLGVVIISTSGLEYELNSKRPKLDKVSDIYLSPSMLEKSRTELENDRTYRVVTTKTCIETIKKLSGYSLGIIKIPDNKLDDTTEITDEDGKAIDNWAAWRAYKGSFLDDGGNISYESLEGRRKVTATFSPSEYFKNTSRYFCIITFTVLILIITAVIITKVILLNKHKKKVFIE